MNSLLWASGKFISILLKQAANCDIDSLWTFTAIASLDFNETNSDVVCTNGFALLVNRRG